MKKEIGQSFSKSIVNKYKTPSTLMFFKVCKKFLKYLLFPSSCKTYVLIHK